MKKLLLLLAIFIFSSCYTSRYYEELKQNRNFDLVITAYPHSHIVAIRGFNYKFMMSDSIGVHTLTLKKVRFKGTLKDTIIKRTYCIYKEGCKY